jgi:hypothetical protein
LTENWEQWRIHQEYKKGGKAAAQDQANAVAIESLREFVGRLDQRIHNLILRVGAIEIKHEGE